MTDVQNNTTLPPLPEAGSSGELPPLPSVPSPGAKDPSVPPPAEKAAGEFSSQFLTGMACLEPVSEACLSRLFRLWEGPQKPAESNSDGVPLDFFHWFFPQAEPQAQPSPEKLLEQGVAQLLTDALMNQAQRTGELLLKSLEHHGKEEPLYTPAQPEAPSCEVKKDSVGNLRKECTIPGEFK